ncbi:MAG: LemA family protein [Xanthobacteraceae bacterium]|nr:LemA family protein [Xanthobacteraceae bacterium]
MMTLAWLAIGFLVVALLCLFVLFKMYTRTSNTLVALDQRCETAFSDIDVHLKHRSNLIPGLVSVVKGLASHEKDLILGVKDARAKALAAAAPAVKLKAERNLSAQVGTLLSAVEKYPEIRALPEFAQLRQQLVDCENRITAARRFHNLAIEEYNTVLRQFPGSWIGPRQRMNSRQSYDLGIERVLIDEPVSIAL